jgi:hypothetical protein
MNTPADLALYTPTHVFINVEAYRLRPERKTEVAKDLHGSCLYII